MPTTYICKCGRIVTKSTNADNTGNRNTDGCEGCPYLLPWGPMVWDERQKAYTQDVKGQECRMSPIIEYATAYYGRADDKCSLHIVSLDLDFLDEVQAWIYDHATDTLTAGFSRGSMRGIEFSDKGRYSLSVLCAQNKRGIAAKASLLAEFFGPDKHRLDMTPEQEKAHILAAIEAGKARAQRKENTMVYKDPSTGWLYRVSPKPDEKSCFFIEYLDPESSVVWKRDHKAAQGHPYVTSVQSRLSYLAKEKGWVPMEVKEWNKPKDAPSGAAAVTTDGSAAAKCGVPDAETRTTPADASGAQLPQPLAQSAPRQTEHATDTAPAAPSVPVFDYSGLDDQTVEVLHVAEREILTARQTYICRVSAAVAAAHEAVVANCDNSKHGNRGEHAFINWCASVGLKKDAAYRLLQVNALLTGATPEEQATLEAASPSLLYAAAKPSAPAEVVQAVKDGDITTHKQYQEAMAQLKAEREAREKAEQEVALASEREEKARAAAHRYHEQYEDAIDQRNRLLDEQGAYISRTTEAEKRAKAAEAAAREAEKQRDGARDALQAAKLRGNQWQEKAEARQARIQELESRPIQTTAMDSDEVDRLVAQRMEEELARQTPRRQEEQEQAARDAYDAFILTARSLDNLWKALKPQISRLAPEQKTGAENLLLQKLMEVKEELINACENCQS